ncbi:MAG: hypothetical protein ACOYWZ_19810 [Bacillota bacterium]
MFKKFIVLFTLAVFVLGLCVTSFAAGENDLLANKDTKDTKQFLVTITRPEGDESTFKKSYVICGNSDKEGITVQLLMYNDKTGNFEPFKNTDEEDTWKIGASGFFMKEIELPNNGANRIRIAAYKDGDKKNLIPGENLQVNTFTVTLLDKGIKDSIKNGFFRITDMLTKLFGT